MSEDILLRGVMAERKVKFAAVSARETVAEARRVHGLSRVCTAALGRALMMSAMMGAALKNEDERLSIIIKGGGMAGNIVTTADMRCRVKGYVENPTLELPPTPDGKLDVALAVGWFGELTVIRDLSMREPYIGRCPIESGELGEDFARYFAQSEQQPSMVYLGVRVDAETGEVLSAGGLLAQPLPGCDEETLSALENCADKAKGLAKALGSGDELYDALAAIFPFDDLEVLADAAPAFKCDCSRERLERVLISLGKEELTDMMEKEHGAELICHFCNKKYRFDENDLARLLSEACGD